MARIVFCVNVLVVAICYLYSCFYWLYGGGACRAACLALTFISSATMSPKQAAIPMSVTNIGYRNVSTLCCVMKPEYTGSFSIFSNVSEMLFCIACMGNGVNGDGLNRDMLCLRLVSNVCDAGKCRDSVFSAQ